MQQPVIPQSDGDHGRILEEGNGTGQERSDFLSVGGAE